MILRNFLFVCLFSQPGKLFTSLLLCNSDPCFRSQIPSLSVLGGLSQNPFPTTQEAVPLTPPHTISVNLGFSFNGLNSSVINVHLPAYYLSASLTGPQVSSRWAGPCLYHSLLSLQHLAWSKCSVDLVNKGMNGTQRELCADTTMDICNSQLHWGNMFCYTRKK